MNQPNFIGLVPMRHSSERVRGKNYRMLDGKPLFHHIVESLLVCPYISEVVIDTDSEVISKYAIRSFENVRTIERPPHLRDGTTSMNDVLIHDVQQLDGDFYVQTHSTNPLLRSETITSAIEAFLSNWPDKDSLFTATRIQTRLWDEHGRAVNHDPDVLLRTQDLPPIYEENSNLYIFEPSRLIERGNRIGSNPLLFEIEREEAWDIDEELDWNIVELIYAQRQDVQHPLIHDGEVHPDGDRHSTDISSSFDMSANAAKL